MSIQHTFTTNIIYRYYIIYKRHTRISFGSVNSQAIAKHKRKIYNIYSVTSVVIMVVRIQILIGHEKLLISIKFVF